MKNAQSIARGIVSNWAGLGVSMVLAFFLSPYVVNSLGSVSYGIWALTLQFTSYLNLLDFGVRDSVIRYTSKYVARNQPRQLSAVLNTALLTYLPIVAVCVLITGACVWLAPGPFKIDDSHVSEARWAVLFAGLTIAQSFLSNVFTGVLAGLRRYDLSNAIGIGFGLLRAAILVLLLSRGFGLKALAALQFIVAMSSSAVTVVVALRVLRRHNLKFSFILPKGRRLPAMARRIFGYGAYSLLHSIGQKVVFASSAIIVGIFLPIAAVTYYSIAGTLVEYLRTILMTTAKVFMPVSSALHARGQKEELRSLFIKAARFNLVLALPAVVIFVFLGAEFIALWMGPEFKQTAGELLVVLALAQLVSAPHNIITTVLYGISQHKIIAWLRVGEAAVNVVLSVVLVQRLGLIGVVLGAAIPHVVLVTLILPRLACPIIGLSVSSYLVGAYVRPLLAGLPMAAVAAWIATSVSLDNLFEFAAALCVLMAVYAPSALFIGLSAPERNSILSKVFPKLAVAR